MSGRQSFHDGGTSVSAKRMYSLVYSCTCHRKSSSEFESSSSPALLNALSLNPGLRTGLIKIHRFHLADRHPSRQVLLWGPQGLKGCRIGR